MRDLHRCSLLLFVLSILYLSIPRRTLVAACANFTVNSPHARAHDRCKTPLPFAASKSRLSSNFDELRNCDSLRGPVCEDPKEPVNICYGYPCLTTLHNSFGPSTSGSGKGLDHSDLPSTPTGLTLEPLPFEHCANIFAERQSVVRAALTNTACGDYDTSATYDR